MEHKLLEDRIIRNEKLLENHGDRILNLERHKSRTEVQIENLIKEISGLINTMRWLMGLIISGLSGFFLWYIKSL